MAAFGRFLPLVKGSSQLPDLDKNFITFAIAYSHSCESEGGENSPPRGKITLIQASGMRCSCLSHSNFSRKTSPIISSLSENDAPLTYELGKSTLETVPPETGHLAKAAHYGAGTTWVVVVR